MSIDRGSFLMLFTPRRRRGSERHRRAECEHAANSSAASPSVRCSELKQSLEPRVAAASLECIAKLSPKDRCDPARVHLYGHPALMNACPDVAPAPADAGAADTPVAALCHGTIEACGAPSVAPSVNECRQLLSGMNEAGRDRTRARMKAHCSDRGLVGCEAAAVSAGK